MCFTVWATRHAIYLLPFLLERLRRLRPFLLPDLLRLLLRRLSISMSSPSDSFLGRIAPLGADLATDRRLCLLTGDTAPLLVAPTETQLWYQLLFHWHIASW